MNFVGKDIIRYPNKGINKKVKKGTKGLKRNKTISVEIIISGVFMFTFEIIVFEI